MYLSKIHIDTWKNFYDSFTNSLKEKINNIIKEQERFNSFSFIYLSSYISLPIINIEYTLISKEDFLDKLNSLERVSIDSNRILIEQFISEFEIDKNFERRIKLLWDFLDKYSDYVSILEVDSRIPRDYTLYYKIIGSLKIKSLGYKESNIRDYIDQLIKKDEISGTILLTFFIGNKYTKIYIKEKLQEIYYLFNIKKSAKASDLEEYFFMKRSQSVEKDLNGNKKKIEGFEIIQLK